MKEYEWKKTLFKTTTTGSDPTLLSEDDSYTDEKTFLAGLIKNAHFRKYRFWGAFWQSLVVTKEVSTVQAFISVFSCALYGSITAATLIAIDVVLYGISVLWVLRSQKMKKRRNSDGGKKRGEEGEVDLKTLLILVTCAYGLSPVLSTLTSSFSSDSIYWSTGLLLVVHLYSYSYCPLGDREEWAEAPGVQSPASLNAAIFASVLLASRLPTAAYVFGFANYALLLFVLFPHIKFTANAASSSSSHDKEEGGKKGNGDEEVTESVMRKARRRYFAINAALFVCNVVLMRPISSALIWIYISLLVFISVICPLILLFIQRYKR